MPTPPPAPVPVEVFAVSAGGPGVLFVNLFYPDTGFGAIITAVSSPSTAANIDTDGDNEAGTPDPIVAPTSQLVFTCADPLTAGSLGGMWQVTDLSGVTFDRPGGTFTSPQSGSNPG